MYETRATQPGSSNEAPQKIVMEGLGGGCCPHFISNQMGSTFDPASPLDEQLCALVGMIQPPDPPPAGSVVAYLNGYIESGILHSRGIMFGYKLSMLEVQKCMYQTKYNSAQPSPINMYRWNNLAICTANAYPNGWQHSIPGGEDSEAENLATIILELLRYSRFPPHRLYPRRTSR